jgi:hypothetical protein
MYSVTDPYAHHVNMWWVDRLIPMWSGQWTPPVGTSLARVYEKEMKSPWRQHWVETHNHKGWGDYQKQADEYWYKVSL